MEAPMTAALDEQWKAHRLRVEAQLPLYVAAHADFPETLRESMLYSLMAGGKRLRPVLVLLAAEACGGQWQEALPAACAIEMVHTYSLVHDDLPAMDDDDLRRGRPTNHVVYGEAMAVLAGDALLTLAFEVIAQHIADKSVAAECCLDLANASGPLGMVAGQVADLAAEHAGEATVEQLEHIHRRKTGRLLCSALTLGGRVAKADTDTLLALARYGNAVGLAFQIADDLLDVQGDPQKLGKQTQKDATAGKLTYPSLIGAEASRSKAEGLIKEACQAISGMGKKGKPLIDMAQFVLSRDH
jgi:geranylgeranyl diphosphate synthase, type II